MSFPDVIKRFLGAKPDKVKVGTRYVGKGEPVFVIAEIGLNHNGDLELALARVHHSQVELALDGLDDGLRRMAIEERSPSEDVSIDSFPSTSQTCESLPRS